MGCDPLQDIIKIPWKLSKPVGNWRMIHMPSYTLAASAGICLTRLILFSNHVNKSDFVYLQTFPIGVARDHATGLNEYFKKSFMLTSRFSHITSNRAGKLRSALQQPFLSPAY